MQVEEPLDQHQGEGVFQVRKTQLANNSSVEFSSYLKEQQTKILVVCLEESILNIKMKFQVIFAVIVICTSSQINAYPVYSAYPVTMREVAEGLVKAFGGLNFKEHINDFLEPSVSLKSIRTFLKNMQDTFTYSSRGEDTVRRVVKMMDHCNDNRMEPVITYPQDSTSCSPSFIRYAPTTSISKPDNFTRDELWNTWLKGRPGLLLSVSSLSDFPGWGNRIWYGLLLLNLLKISCYSGDETLKELWHRIPEPAPTAAFENFTIQELWNTQRPPLFLLPEFVEQNVSATKDMWDKIHYQLMFHHIVHAKCEYQDAVSERWRRLIPTDSMELLDDSAVALWEELTIPRYVLNSEGAWKILSDKLYSPLLAQWNLKFSMFGDLNTVDRIYY